MSARSFAARPVLTVPKEGAARKPDVPEAMAAANSAATEQTAHDNNRIGVRAEGLEAKAQREAASETQAEMAGGIRIARLIARAGLASRRGAEELIRQGRVAINGRVLTTPAVTVMPEDRVMVDGKPLPLPEPVRVWRYHKPKGLVTTTQDPQGRKTVFEALPKGLPRMVSIGRLDLNSEGLLLLTNDGELKRRLELPSTGWLRRYRVRVHGTPTEAMLDRLRHGITVDGVHYQPMEVRLDRVIGTNAWLTISVREGKNREVRRALQAVGLQVTRLIRVAYGPFQLGLLPRGQIEEIPARVLREQLGPLLPNAFARWAEPGKGENRSSEKGRGEKTNPRAHGDAFHEAAAAAARPKRPKTLAAEGAPKQSQSLSQTQPAVRQRKQKPAPQHAALATGESRNTRRPAKAAPQHSSRARLHQASSERADEHGKDGQSRPQPTPRKPSQSSAGKSTHAGGKAKKGAPNEVATATASSQSGQKVKQAPRPRRSKGPSQ